MTTPTTLLAAVMPLFTDQTERVATEALRHILQHSDPARAALSTMLHTAGVATDPLTRFQTEVSGDDGERVDLVCSDAAGTERILIEAKFWASLTDNQPNTTWPACRKIAPRRCCSSPRPKDSKPSGRNSAAAPSISSSTP